MYQRCVQAGECVEPIKTGSSTRNRYFWEEEFQSYPAIYINWFMAKDYCKWVGCRLPAEAKREKAERGPNGNIYPWGNDSPYADFVISNNQRSGIDDTAAVGSYPMDKSFYGVFDMGGNVMEWVSDWYDSDYYENIPSVNPHGLPSGKYRVLRGDSFSIHIIDPQCNRSPGSGNCDPFLMFANVGFRCVRDVE